MQTLLNNYANIVSFLQPLRRAAQNGLGYFETMRSIRDDGQQLGSFDCQQ